MIEGSHLETPQAGSLGKLNILKKPKINQRKKQIIKSIEIFKKNTK